MGVAETVRFLLQQLAGASGAERACLRFGDAAVVYDRRADAFYDCFPERVAFLPWHASVLLDEVEGELFLSGVPLEEGELAGLGRFCGRALANAQKYDAAMEKAAVDGLTGLPNRAAFMDRLKEEAARGARYRRRFSIVFVDLDNFKLVNDTYGHLAGDEALFRVAAALRQCVRRSDFIARYGGDEFVVFVPEASAGEAARVADRIAGEVQKVCAGEIALTASCGIACWPEDGEDPESLVRVADGRMYETKAGKRNAGTEVSARCR
jgi:diguanylate cyclase (GGDEF)-like protein